MSNINQVKEMILEILKSKEFEKILSSFKSNKLVDFIKFCGFILSILTSIFIIQLNLNEGVRTRLIEIINNEIKTKTDAMNRMLEPIMNVRKERTLLVIKCKYDHVSNYEQETRRFNARHEVSKNSAGIELIFDGQVRKKITAFVAFDESIKDVCAKNAPSDEEWRKRYDEIKDLLTANISAEKKEQLEINQNKLIAIGKKN